MTSAEKRLWPELRILDVRIRRQAPIGPYMVDFACHAASLVIELDGPLHDLEEEQIHDAIRTAWLESQGYRVMRFRNRQAFEQPGLILAQIEAALPKAARP